MHHGCFAEQCRKRAGLVGFLALRTQYTTVDRTSFSQSRRYFIESTIILSTTRTTRQLFAAPLWVDCGNSSRQSLLVNSTQFAYPHGLKNYFSSCIEPTGSIWHDWSLKTWIFWIFYHLSGREVGTDIVFGSWYQPEQLFWETSQNLIVHK